MTTSGPGTTATTVTTSVVTSTSSTTTGGRQVTLSQSCTHVERDVRVQQVRYPEGWDVNDGDGIQAAPPSTRTRSPIPPATEFPRELAVLLLVEPVPFAGIRRSSNEGEGERRLTIDGRSAARQEVVTTGEGFGPAGQRSIRYVIDAGTRARGGTAARVSIERQ